jgi:hypothetical protein
MTVSWMDLTQMQAPTVRSRTKLAWEVSLEEVEEARGSLGVYLVLELHGWMAMTVAQAGSELAPHQMFGEIPEEILDQRKWGYDCTLADATRTGKAG